MNNLHIDGFEDNTEIHGFGSFFKHNNAARWNINLSVSPNQTKQFTSLSQAPILTRKRIINATNDIYKKGYLRNIEVESSQIWETCKIADCPILNNKNKSENEQFCFKFTTNSGMTVYLPQFELARVLFFRDGYLSRTAMNSTELSIEFDIDHDSDDDSVIVNVLDSTSYCMEHFNNEAARSTLSWVLLDPNARTSYESIHRYYRKNVYLKNNYEHWFFQFEKPNLDGAKLQIKGLYNDSDDIFFVNEITSITNLRHSLSQPIIFTHSSFTELDPTVESKNYTKEQKIADKYALYDNLTPNSDTAHRMVSAPSTMIGFATPINTRKEPKKRQTLSTASFDDQSKDDNSDITSHIGTEEGANTGTVLRAEWDTTVNTQDDECVYENKFSLFLQMISYLENNFNCQVIDKKITKLPIIEKHKKHLLQNTAEPRCIAVIEIAIDTKVYHILEVDTSDSAKPLATKVINFQLNINLEAELNDINERLVKKSLLWPQERLNLLSGNQQVSASHPQKINYCENIDEATLHRWSARVFSKFID
ncbi:Tn7-like element transposition protein TnsE [Moritella marina]|uniref:Tn7-like element transposition protein TnsE n=1 Tax=Moritella marina TaxID=90736 RepID=UPI0037038901